MKFCNNPGKKKTRKQVESYYKSMIMYLELQSAKLRVTKPAELAVAGRALSRWNQHES